jgi:hypothetical protein
MRPELVKEFIAVFHHEINRPNRDRSRLGKSMQTFNCDQPSLS